MVPPIPHPPVIVHIAFILIFIGALAYVLINISGLLGYVPVYVLRCLKGTMSLIHDSAYYVFMAIFTIALVLEPVEMVFDSYRLLEPWLYLSFQVYKALFSTLFLIIVVVGSAKGNQDALTLQDILILVAMA